MVDRARLYAITPPAIALEHFIPQVEQAFEGGDIACLQLRLKDATDVQVREAVKALMPLCHAHEAAFILNDSVDLALELGVDGVHLGQEDLLAYDNGSGRPIAQIREKLPEEMTLGITCHASMHLAMEAGEQDADYVAFGAFYPTTSKPKEKLEKWGTPTTDLLESWSQGSLLPCVAIGGITPENGKPLVRAGADFIAVITGIWNHPDGPKAAVMAYNNAIDDALAA